MGLNLANLEVKVKKLGVIMTNFGVNVEKLWLKVAKLWLQRSPAVAQNDQVMASVGTSYGLKEANLWP